tara:strand:- start:254 stop:466 length:213 start_codon:yes stop_codon:yes gene_type:complete
MYYKVNVWKNDELKKEIYYKADNDIIAMQKASAAIPDGCRATYEEINEETFKKETETKTIEKTEEAQIAI